MHRKNLLELLESYFPTLEEEKRAKEKIMEFVLAHENCFERTLSVGHITASAWVENEDGSKALLMHHQKLDKWLQVGGHSDGCPDIFSSALREAIEESGLEHIEIKSQKIFDVDVHLIPKNKKEKSHYHYDIRVLLRATGNVVLNKNHESKELRWISKSLSDLPTREPSVVRMFEKWIQN